MSGHDSHLLLLLDLLFLLLIVLHDLQPLRLHKSALLDIELLLSLQGAAKSHSRSAGQMEAVPRIPHINNL